jgi:hypothetical protein
MSKHINVNPDHYKTAGRARQGEDVVHERHKAALAKNRERATARERSGRRARPAPSRPARRR